jgi:F0F1-type ATP synthase assembly protein I
MKEGKKEERQKEKRKKEKMANKIILEFIRSIIFVS